MNPLLRQLRAPFIACLLLASSLSLADPPTPLDAALVPLQAAYTRAVTPGEQADFHRELLAPILARLQRSYATEVNLAEFVAAATKVLEPLPPGAGNPAEVFKKAINTALRTLDPYSRYLDPAAHSSEVRSQSGSFVGLGVQFEAGEGGLRVTGTLPESPAERAGLQAGDVIVQVDNESLHGVPFSDAMVRLRGQLGTQVALSIRRPGVELDFTVYVTREAIRRQLVRWNMEGDVLVLRLSSFSGPATSALAQAITEASTAGTPRSVVLDLRGNTGGLLREGVLVADAFLAKGEIVSVRGRTSSSQRSWQADAHELMPGAPMVVLVDKRTASAAELVADALQDNGRAKVIGQRSYGKGSVQLTYGLGEERKGALKLTTSLYHGPSGRTVQSIGVAPDIEVASTAAAADPSKPARAHSVRVAPTQCPAVLKSPDPDLACALAFLQAGSVEAFLAEVGESQ